MAPFRWIELIRDLYPTDVVDSKWKTTFCPCFNLSNSYINQSNPITFARLARFRPYRIQKSLIDITLKKFIISILFQITLKTYKKYIYYPR